MRIAGGTSRIGHGSSAARRLLMGALCLALCALPACRSLPRPEKSAPPPRVSPALRGSGSGLEMWWWVVGDKPIERRLPPKPPREEPTKPLPKVGPDPSASAEEFTARRLKKEEVKQEEQAAGSEEPRPPTFTISDDRTELEEALAPFVHRPVPLPEEVLRLWRDSGLRIIAVPRGELEAIEAKLRLVAPVQRQWLGEMPAWTDILQGPWSEGGRTVLLGEEPMRLDAGRLRLLARCWSAPLGGEEARAGLRLEMVPHHEPLHTDEQRMLIAAGMLSGSEADGVMFERLAAATVLERDDALVIVPMGRPVGHDGEMGPFVPQERTLGEAMLARDMTETRARARAVIVLLPRMAERFELLR